MAKPGTESWLMLLVGLLVGAWFFWHKCQRFKGVETSLFHDLEKRFDNLLRGWQESIPKEVPTACIASSSLGGDELLWWIFQEAGTPERLCAVSYLADQTQYSNLVGRLAEVPVRLGNSAEDMLMLDAGLVVVSPYNRPELLAQVERLGVPVYVLPQINSLEDIGAVLIKLGNLVGASTAAERVKERFEQDLQTIAAPAKRLVRDYRVLYWTEQGVSMGLKSTFSSMLEALGAENELFRHFGQLSWIRLGREQQALLNPDYLVLPGKESEQKNFLLRLHRDSITNRWPAVQNERFIFIPRRLLSSHSPFVIEALRLIRRGVYGF